jgi:regulator of cell morphogenesis and NO signaling
MKYILATWTVNDALRHLPETAATFNRFGIDTCCGGGLTLEAAAQSAGLSTETLLEALGAALEAA